MDIPYTADNISQSSFYFYNEPTTGIISLIVTVIGSLSGTVGNILVIGAVLTHKKLRKVGNAFIVNLAIADLCVTALVGPFSVVGLFYGKPWFLQRYEFCVTLAVLCLASCATSLFSIGAVSFNRFIHIVHHNHYDKVYTLKNTILMCFVLWVASFCIVLPTLFNWGGHRYDDKTEMCVWNRVADLSYTVVFVAGIGIVVPVVLTAICYLRIFLFVRAQKKKISAATSNKNDGRAAKSRKENMKLALTLFIIFLVFVMCWLPYTVLIVADVYDTFPKWLHFWAIQLAHTNSSLNAIVYGLSDKNFRSGYMHILGLDKCAEKWTRKSETFDENSLSESRVPTVKK